MLFHFIFHGWLLIKNFHLVKHHQETGEKSSDSNIFMNFVMENIELDWYNCITDKPVAHLAKGKLSISAKKFIKKFNIVKVS